MEEKKKIWYEVKWIPKWVNPGNKLSFHGKYFVKKDTYEKILECENVAKNI